MIREGDYVTTLFRNSEHFVFVYRDETRTLLLRQLGRMAADPDSSFTWYDAAIVSARVRQFAEQVPSLSEATGGLVSDEDCEGV